jgi:hypothetical protein
LGLQRARTDRILGVEPWLKDGIEAGLITLSQNLREMPPGHDITTRTDLDLLQARDEVRTFLQLVNGFSHLAEYYWGKYAFGMSAMAQAIQEARADDQAMMLLFWLDMRSWGLGEAMDVFAGLAQQWESLWSQTVTALQLLAREVPETADVLEPKRMRTAFKSHASMDTLLTQLRELYEQYKEPIMAFWAQHPEFGLLQYDQLPPAGEKKSAPKDPSSVSDRVSNKISPSTGEEGSTADGHQGK